MHGGHLGWPPGEEPAGNRAPGEVPLAPKLLDRCWGTRHEAAAAACGDVPGAPPQLAARLSRCCSCASCTPGRAHVSSEACRQPNWSGDH